MIPILFSVQLSVLLYLCMVSLPYLLSPTVAEHRRCVDDYVLRHLARLRRRQARRQLCMTTTKTTTTAAMLSY